jgi:hypothetical protein
MCIVHTVAFLWNKCGTNRIGNGPGTVYMVTQFFDVSLYGSCNKQQKVPILVPYEMSFFIWVLRIRMFMGLPDLNPLVNVNVASKVLSKNTFKKITLSCHLVGH